MSELSGMLDGLLKDPDALSGVLGVLGQSRTGGDKKPSAAAEKRRCLCEGIRPWLGEERRRKMDAALIVCEVIEGMQNKEGK